MEQIKDRILKLQPIEWRKLKELQPPDLKHISNITHIKQSIQKNGFAFPFAVWQDNTGDIYAIDGHTRKHVLEEMDNVPDALPAFFIAADDRNDAIQILLEVYNQRHNEINPLALTEWLNVEQIEVETVNIGSLNTGIAGLDYSNKNKELNIDEMEENMVLKLEYTPDEYNTVRDQLSKIAQTPEQAVWKLLGNE